MVSLSDGKAVIINVAMNSFLTKHNLDPKKMVGLGSDGASVMVGKTGGVCII